MNPSVLLFDFDGTLVDASEAICRSFNAGLAAFGYPTWPAQRIRPLIGRTLREMYAAAAPGADAARVEELIAAYRAAFLPISVPLSRLLPGVREGCRAWAARRRLGIVTNRARHGAEHILEGFGLRDAFAVIVGLDDVVHAKPHPEALLTALRRLGATPDEAVMIGDTPDDLRAAAAAGLRGLGVTTGSYDAAALTAAGAAAALPSLAELDAALDALPN